MRRNAYVSVDVEKLVFDCMEEEPDLITIPIKGSKSAIVCGTRPGSRAYIKENLDGVWCRSLLDEETTVKIYKKLEEVT